jgi:hypothetical protein
LNQIGDYDIPIQRVDDSVSPDRGFVITPGVSLHTAGGY